MLFLRSQFCAIALLACIGLACDHSAACCEYNCAALKIIDRDNDGTVDMNEVNQAATATFTKLDKNKMAPSRPENCMGDCPGVSSRQRTRIAMARSAKMNTLPPWRRGSRQLT